MTAEHIRQGITRKPRKKPNQNNKYEENKMTTQVDEVEVDITFPRTVGDLVFQTPEEFKTYVEELDKNVKELKKVVKATKPGRPTSEKKKLSEAVAAFLNENMDDNIREQCSKIEEDFNLRLSLIKGVFLIPVTKTREGGGGNRGGRKITVDGQDYPSSKGARDTLYPEMKDKNQNYSAISKYLKNKGHEVVEHEAEKKE